MAHPEKHEKHHHISSQKVVFSFLGVVSFAALVLGMINISQHITDPIRDQQAEQQEVAQREAVFEQFSEDAVARRSDTDLDGLSDYDELHRYGTSPYLADSDSDGFPDSEEIATGNDPNCPAGVNCRFVESSDDDIVVTEPIVDTGTTGGVGDVPVLDINNLSIAEIREIILASGEISAEQLAQVDDETLMEIYQSVLGEGN